MPEICGKMPRRYTFCGRYTYGAHCTLDANSRVVKERVGGASQLTAGRVIVYMNRSGQERWDQRPFIDRPAALSAISLSWLRRIWNLGEGGLLCTKQAKCWLACCVHNRPPALKFQYSLNTFSLGLSSLWGGTLGYNTTNPFTHGLFKVHDLMACGLNCLQICGRICPRPWEMGYSEIN